MREEFLAALRDGYSQSRIIGRKILIYDLVTSTNDLALMLARQGECEGTVLFAAGQTNGRGRLGKKWVSPHGSGLYLSAILRPRLDLDQASFLTICAGVAMCKVLDGLGVENVSIRWPNDVCVRGRKICGILTEAEIRGRKMDHLVLGIGMNVNASCDELVEGATSIKEELGRKFDLTDLGAIILRELDQEYERLLSGRFLKILEDFRQWCDLCAGTRVKIAWADKELEGFVVEFDESGRILIRKDDGTVERVSAGHLTKIA